MQYKSPVHIQGMIRFWWHVSLYLVADARRKLGFTLLDAKPFLPRRERMELARLVALLEPVLRRIFYLRAIELGPLERGRRATRKTSPRTDRPVIAPSPKPSRTAPPRFRIVESGGAAPPSRKAVVRYRTGPAIRFLDQDYPVDLREYLSRPEDLLPSGPLVRRLAAINHALCNGSYYVAAMRRRIAAALPVVNRKLPPAFRARWVAESLRISAGELHAELNFAASPDTS